MLVVRRVSAEGHRYYLSAVGPLQPEGYVIGEPPGRWIGAGSRLVGAEGLVAPTELRRALHGQHPTTGNALTMPRRRRLAGLDLVFAAPKSFSLATGLSPPEVRQALYAGHDTAVTAAVSYLERSACVVRRADAARLQGAGFVAAVFRHRTSRLGDPHLHSHVVVSNITQGPDRRWSSIHTPLIFGELRTAGSLYAAALRRQTSALGLGWVPVGGGRFELAGVPRNVIEAFSQRHAQIRSRVEEDLRARPRSVRGAVFLTRPRRAGLVDIGALTESWHLQSEALGFAIPPAWRSLGRGVDQTDDEGRDLHPDELTETSDVFGRSDLIRAWCGRLASGASVPDVEALADATIARADVVPLAARSRGRPARLDGPSGLPLRYTSVRTLAVADQLVALANDGAQRSVPIGVLCIPRGSRRWELLARVSGMAAGQHRVVLGVGPSAGGARDLSRALVLTSGAARLPPTGRV